ncbi:MAG: hypothetical protein QNJ46_12870 [Leptolyngbyaceae cyanobacterium MO_188.B28]|nr:hypothetical protein [Leptolyngbyaceae cyanobacterium MO_188.B28]
MVTSADSSDLSWLTPEALVDFIDGLREAGYNIGLSQYIAAQDLVLAISTQDGVVDQPHRLKTLLGPILCSTPFEQEDFQRRFDVWIRLIDPTAKPVKPEPLEEELQQVERRTQRMQRILVYSALFLVGFLASVLLNHWLLGTSELEISSSGELPPVESSIPEETPLPEFPNPENTSPTVISRPRQTPNFPASSIALIVLTPGLVRLAWQFWWQRQAKLFLQRRAVHQPPELDKITIPDSDQSLFPSALFVQIAHLLRQRISIPSNEIDIEKTLHASLRHGGWLSPIYGNRKVPPEYLFLIDRSSYRDHQARFVQEAIARLRQNDVFITCYTFDGDPRICLPFHGKDSPQRLAELAAKYSQHRLLLFVEADQLFRSDTGHIAPWIEPLTRWRDRVILTPKAIEQWGYLETELTEQFVVLPATVQGLQDFVQSLQQGKTTLTQEDSCRAPLPPPLRLHPRRWIARNPPPQSRSTQCC